MLKQLCCEKIKQEALLRSSFSWDIMQRGPVVMYLRFGTTCRWIFKGLEGLGLDEAWNHDKLSIIAYNMLF